MDPIIRSEADAVLVKFTVYNITDIPNGVRKHVRDEAAQEAKQDERAKQHGVKRGDQREGKVDTGHSHEYHDVVPITGFIGELLAYGFFPSDSHWFRRPDKNQKNRDRYFVVFTFSRGVMENTDLLDLADELGSRVWKNVHVWHNPPREDGQIVDTINCLHPSKKPVSA